MKVTTNTPVMLDGEMIEPGTTVDVNNAVGKQLVEAGSADLAGKVKRDADAPAPTPGGDPVKTGE